MARSTYAIRNGFEYQDLYCAYQLLQHMLAGELDVRFNIESDDALHVDDFVKRPTADAIEGHQVKYHVDQDYAESFETLSARKTSKSRSLIEKLHRGWQSLVQTGAKTCRLVFVSTNPPERGRFKLGPVIDTKTGKFSDKFFDHNDYAKWRNDLAKHLKIDLQELRNFLSVVEWRLSSQSSDGLRRLIMQTLRQLWLPSDEDAVARLMEVVGHIATTPCGEQAVRWFIQELWKTSRFRDACEQRFPVIDFGVGQMRRANVIHVAAVNIDVLPAYSGTRFNCLEEPFPFSDYRRGITATDEEALLDSFRTAWKQEYMDWLNKKVEALLAAIPATEIDFLVFPRFSLPLEIASLVAKWGKDNHVHCILGGHSLPQAFAARSLYQSDLNIAVDVPEQAGDGPTTDFVVDPMLRYDRVGRYSMSELDSPFARKEAVQYEVDSIQVLARDGWVTAVLLPSRDGALSYLEKKPGRPEVVFVAGGVHANEVCDLLAAQPTLEGCPVVVASPNLYTLPWTFTLEKGAVSFQQTDAWEGISFSSIRYDRSAVTGWVCEVTDQKRLPLVYKATAEQQVACGSSAPMIRGTRACRDEAARRSQEHEAPPAIEVHAEDSASFFWRRSAQAREVVRSSLPKASPDQISVLSDTLKAIEAATEEYRKQAELPQSFTPTAARPIPIRYSKFHDRATEKEAIARFLEGVGGKRLLVLHGQPGIGKKEILAEVQRLSPDKGKWVRFRCTPNSRLDEMFSQFLVRLGSTGLPLPKLDSEFFGLFLDRVVQQGYTVAILEEAHHLPLAADHADHTAFLEFLTYLCSDRYQGQVRVVLVSDWRGRLQFSGSHQMDTLHVEGLDREYVVEMLQEHLISHASSYRSPTVDELSTIATRLHGHPYVTKIASVVLETSPASEVIEKLYSHIETRQFIVGRLLGRIKLTEQEQQFLEFASILRVPVSSEAFAKLGGSSSHSLLEELLDRFLLVSEDGLFKLHPVLTEFFSTGLNDPNHFRRLHTAAFSYFESISKRRQLTVEERVEYVYHGVTCGKPMDLRDMQAFAGSVRSALTEGVRSRDWTAVESAAKQLLSVWPYEAVGQVGMALVMEATGREHEAAQYLSCLDYVSLENLWLAIEFVKSRIRRRDFDGAERTLAVVGQRFSNSAQVIVAEAQLYERRGETDKAVAACERVLAAQGVKQHEAFAAGLILRDANRLDVLVRYVEGVHYGSIRHEGLLRLYGIACVVTNHDPQEGLNILSQLWDAAPSDGAVVADYATALRAVGRTVDAKGVIGRGLNEVPRRSKGRRPLLEAQADNLEKEGQFVEAFGVYRELVSSWPNYLHLHRKYAACLLNAAAEFRSAHDSAREDSAVNEAKVVLKKLLQMANLDKWAADALHRAEVRAY